MPHIKPNSGVYSEEEAQTLVDRAVRATLAEIERRGWVPAQEGSGKEGVGGGMTRPKSLANIQAAMQRSYNGDDSKIESDKSQ